MCQVQLIVPVGLHHHMNICCKTWHKKPVTAVCIGCHTLCWQFYHQWLDECWCVAAACCLHIIVPGIVCGSGDITVKFQLCCNCCHSSTSYAPFNPIYTPLTDIYIYTYMTILPHHLSWYDTCHWGWSQMCHVGIWADNTWTVTVCVSMCFLNVKLCVLQFCRNLLNH
jgi:hypothetical protein